MEKEGRLDEGGVWVLNLDGRWKRSMLWLALRVSAVMGLGVREGDSGG